MADVTFLQNSPLAPRPRTGAAPANAPPARAPGYEGADDVVARAGVQPHRASVRELAALIRLDKVVSKGEPPRTDVPRGYYLDIKV